MKYSLLFLVMLFVISKLGSIGVFFSVLLAPVWMVYSIYALAN